MDQIFKRSIVVSAFFTLCASASMAQQPNGWTTVFDGLAVYQDDADLSGGGSFSASRQFLRFGGRYRGETGTSYGLLLSLGEYSYNFDAATVAPWGDVRDIRISAPIRFSAGDRASVFLSPQLRWDYETDASASDGFTYGVFAGVTWNVSPTLHIGPAFGVFSQVEDDDLEVFPAVLINWDFADRWNLSTSAAPGASQGPGISLTYQVSSNTSFSLSTRYERTRFRLDGNGLAPNGVGEDSSLPVVLSVDYKPSPRMSFNAFLGMEFDGELSLEDATGATISTQSYEDALIAGLSFRLLF